MLNILKQSFGGLRKEYFFRNLVLGVLLGIGLWMLIDALEARSTSPKPLADILAMKVFIVISALLYPYAKFLYDYAWELILGDRIYAYSINIFTIWFMFIARLMCWFFAWALAPIGLIILYFKNR